MECDKRLCTINVIYMHEHILGPQPWKEAAGNTVGQCLLVCI